MEPVLKARLGNVQMSHPFHRGGSYNEPGAKSLLSVAYVAAVSNIDPEAKRAWSVNVGWIRLGMYSGGGGERI